MGDGGLFTSQEAPIALKALRKAFRAPYHGRPGFRGGEALPRLHGTGSEKVLTYSPIGWYMDNMSLKRKPKI